MKRLFSVIVLIAVLVAPIAANAQTGCATEVEWVQIADHTFDPAFSIGEATGEGVSGTLLEFTYDVNAGIFDHKPSEKKGDFGLFPFLGKSFYRFVLKPAYKVTKASGKTGGKAVKFFFVQVGHFLF